MTTKIPITNSDSHEKFSFDVKYKRKQFQLLADLIILHPSSTASIVQMSGISSSEVIFNITRKNGSRVSELDLKKISDYMGLNESNFKISHIFYFYDGRYRHKIKEFIPKIFKNGAFFIRENGLIYLNNNVSSIIINGRSDFVDEVLRSIPNILPGEPNIHFSLESRSNQREINLFFKCNDFDVLATWNDAEELAKNSQVNLKDVLCFIRKSDASSTRYVECDRSRLAKLAIQDMSQKEIALNKTSIP